MPPRDDDITLFAETDFRGDRWRLGIRGPTAGPRGDRQHRGANRMGSPVDITTCPPTAPPVAHTRTPLTKSRRQFSNRSPRE
jgi:hypothetical protein